MRILVTGSTGFVGRHLLRAVRAMRHDVDIKQTAQLAECDEEFGEIARLDVSDRTAVESAVKIYSPTHVVHLASIAAPIQADREFLRTWDVNTLGTLYLCRAIMEYAPRACLLYVGSGLAYGANAKLRQPIDETVALAPLDNYGASKASADLAVGAFANQGLKAIRFRPFNHTGPGQSEKFVVPAFAAQIARIEAGLHSPVIRVGDLKAERDFLDVRDVVAAYVQSILKANAIETGTILNIASGVPRTIASILDGLIALARVPITVEQDRMRIRTSDSPRMVGNAEAAQRVLGWKLTRKFQATLHDTLDYWRQRVRHDAQLP